MSNYSNGFQNADYSFKSTDRYQCNLDEYVLKCSSITKYYTQNSHQCQSINSQIIHKKDLTINLYVFLVVLIIMIVLLFLQRTITSFITKDDHSPKISISWEHLFENLLALLKSLHWINCDYSKVAFVASCFVLFMVLLPLLLVLWILMLGYRQFIHHNIKVSKNVINHNM